MTVVKTRLNRRNGRPTFGLDRANLAWVGDLVLTEDGRTGWEAEIVADGPGRVAAELGRRIDLSPYRIASEVTVI